MPASNSAYVFHDDDDYIVGVSLTTEITSTQADGIPFDYLELTVAQLTAAGVNSDDDLNDLIGKEITDEDTVTTYTPSPIVLRGRRRASIHGRIREIMLNVPSAASKDTSGINGIHFYAQMVYAAASVDANMDSDTIYDIIETAAKISYLDAYKNLSTSTTLYNSWNAYFDPESGDSNSGGFFSVNSSYEPSRENSISMPGSWNSSGVTTYRPENVL